MQYFTLISWYSTVDISVVIVVYELLRSTQERCILRNWLILRICRLSALVFKIHIEVFYLFKQFCKRNIIVCFVYYFRGEFFKLLKTEFVVSEIKRQ